MTLPKEWKGGCARVRAIQKVSIINWGKDSNGPSESKPKQRKHAYVPESKVRLDAIGQLRGILNEFKN